MNKTLLVSIHGLVAAAFVTALVIFGVATRATFQSIPTGSRTFLLVSGWITLAFFAAAYAYVLRKYAHKLGYSPEFRMRVPRASIERAQERIDEVRLAIALGTLKGDAEILEKARRILREEKCEQILRVRVDGTGGAKTLIVTRTEPIGRVARWMHAHIYYGFAAGLLTIVHGRAYSTDTFGSPMAIALNGLTLLVVLTGLVGLAFWLYGPTWLTRLERDLTSEEVFVLARHYDRRTSEALAEIENKDKALASAARTLDPARMREIEARLVSVLAQIAPPDAARPAIEAQARDLLALCGQRRRLQAELARLSRARFWMNAWRIVHIPASIVLLAVIFVHVLTVWLY